MVDQTFRDSYSSKAVEIVEEHGSFLLVRTASGFAVIERWNGRIYPISPSEREGINIVTHARGGLGLFSWTECSVVRANLTKIRSFQA